MIFDALQSEIFRSKFHSLGSEIPKTPEFNLHIEHIMPELSLISYQGQRGENAATPLLSAARMTSKSVKRDEDVESSSV